MVLALVTALFVSCSQDNVGSVVGEDLVSVSFATGGSSRALTVSREVFDEYDYIWCYTAVKADNSGMTQGETRDGGLIKEAYVWGDNHTKTGLTGAEISGLSQGLWNFTLRAYVPIYEGSVITGKSDVRAWFGSVTNQPVRKGEANVVNVTVSAVIDPDNKGTITFEDVVVRKLNNENVTAPEIWMGQKDLVLGVKAKTLAGAAVADAFVSYYKGEGHTMENIPAPKFELAAGSYLVTFKAYEGEFDAPTFTYAEETIAVNVYSGLKTIIGGYISELSSYVVFGEPVANAVIEASTPSVIEVTPQSAPISFVTDSTQSTSYKAASIPAVAVVAIKENVVIPEGSTLTDLALSLNVEDKGSTDASEKTTKKFEISLDAVVTTTDESTGSVTVESSSVTGGIVDFMTVQLYIGKELADLKVYHHDVEVMESGSQLFGAEYYEYDSTSAGDGILTLHVNSFSPFSVEYSKKVAVARLIKADGTGSDFYTLQEAVAAAANGDTVKLLKDVEISAAATKEADRLTINKDITIDFGACRLIAPGSLEPTSNWAALWITGNVVFEGTTGGIDCLDNQDDCGPYAVNIKDGGTLTVEGGVYHGGGTAIQVQEGALYINGGSFSVTAFGAPYGYDFLINCVDDAYKAGNARAEIKGGTFDHFNPADNASEGAHTNYVPAGYDVVVEGNLYTVVPYVGEGVVVNMTSVPRTYYTLVEGKLADLDGDFIPEEELPAKTDKLVLLDSSLSNTVDDSIDNFNSDYTWSAIHPSGEEEDTTNFAGGYGTKIEPYLITNRGQLLNTGDYYYHGDYYFKVVGVSEIDCSNWEQISYFSGSLNGKGVTLTNLDSPLIEYIWDGYAGTTATFKNINVVCNMHYNDDRGALITYTGVKYTVFDNVNVSGIIESSLGCSPYIGYGAYGYNYYYFNNCVSDVTLVATGGSASGFVNHPGYSTYEGPNPTLNAKIFVTDSAYIGRMSATGSSTEKNYNFKYFVVNSNGLAVTTKYSDNFLVAEGLLYATPSSSTINPDGSKTFNAGNYGSGVVDYYRPNDSNNMKSVLATLSVEIPSKGQAFSFAKVANADHVVVTLEIGANDASGYGNYVGTYEIEDIDISSAEAGAIVSTTKVLNFHVVVIPENDNPDHRSTGADGDTYYVISKRNGSTYGSAVVRITEYDASGNVLATKAVSIKE